MRRPCPCFYLLLAFCLSAQASPLQELKLVGEGRVSWFFMDIYRASLYSPSGRYDAGDTPVALAIRYSRSISRDQLISTTLEQWQKLGIRWNRDWLARLEALWPSVGPGDEIVFFMTSPCEGEFYINRQPVGGIDDCAFGSNFLAIWLSPNTTQPDLRRALMGDTDV